MVRRPFWLAAALLLAALAQQNASFITGTALTADSGVHLTL